MTAKRDALVSLVVAAAMCCWAGPAGAASVPAPQKCEAAKVTAAGTKQKCLALERAKELKGKPFDYAKCDTKFMKSFDKAEDNAGPGVCPSEGDAAAVEAQVDAAADRLRAALSGDTPPATHLFPATGETTCWDSTGAAIACAGTGQDGDIQAGATLSYTDNLDGTITDNNTGLMWEQKGDNNVDPLHAKETTYTWANAFAVHIAGLNAGAGFAGHTDWRLPNIKELQSIVNYENGFPAVSPIFNTACESGCNVTTCSCTAVGDHWSSSTWTALDRDKAWLITFNGGFVNVDAKSAAHIVRAVRGGL